MVRACRARPCSVGRGQVEQPRKWRGTAVRATRAAGPAESPPDYSEIDSHPVNKAIMALFRRKMVARIGEDCEEQGYAGIIALTRKLNSMYKGEILISVLSLIRVYVPFSCFGWAVYGFSSSALFYPQIQSRHKKQPRTFSSHFFHRSSPHFSR
jgi:hypothetical protein